MQVFQSVAVWCLLASDLQLSASALGSCNTAWLDDHSVSSVGDSELIQDLIQDLRGGARVCRNPLLMEARTRSGVSALHTGNHFHTFSAAEGLLCLNSDQEGGQCEDYQVRFTCSGDFCSECRTRWFDHDDPTGNGDFEMLNDIVNVFPREICSQPTAIEAQTVSGEPVDTTNNFLTYDASSGFSCVNKDQSSRCEDYRVRFTCPTGFCQVSEQCRTQWLNSDDPSQGWGDVESIAQLLKTFPGRVCRNPLSIEAQTLRGVSAEHTGDSFLSYDTTFGFACMNEKQSSKQCEDYQVILTCPSDFCQGCRTRWFDEDDPSERGDFETLIQLKMMFPDEICSEPISIEAKTLSGVPANQTGDLFQIYDASRGFACVNAEQPGGRLCQDYRVRLTCPEVFCSL